jgi:hypothetical protein
MWSVGGTVLAREGKGSAVTVSLYLPEISHGETWDRSGERPPTNRLSQNQTPRLGYTNQSVNVV